MTESRVAACFCQRAAAVRLADLEPCITMTPPVYVTLTQPASHCRARHVPSGSACSAGAHGLRACGRQLPAAVRRRDWEPRAPRHAARRRCGRWGRVRSGALQSLPLRSAHQRLSTGPRRLRLSRCTSAAYQRQCLVTVNRIVGAARRREVADRDSWRQRRPIMCSQETLKSKFSLVFQVGLQFDLIKFVIETAEYCNNVAR